MDGNSNKTEGREGDEETRRRASLLWSKSPPSPLVLPPAGGLPADHRGPLSSGGVQSPTSAALMLPVLLFSFNVHTNKLPCGH